MDVGALADRFFQAICQVAYGARHAFARDGQRRADSVLDGDNVNVLRLEPPKNRDFGDRSGFRVVDEAISIACFFNLQGWPWIQFGRMETAFQYQAAGDVLVQGPDVKLALRSTLEFGKVFKGTSPVEPGRGFSRRHWAPK